jgi:hypothetical protein
VPPDVTWLGALAGCGGWLGIVMPGLCVVELLLPVLPPGEMLPLLLVPPLPAVLLGVLVLAGVLVAWAGW